MRLELDTEEVKRILLSWAKEKFPGSFDTVELQNGYSVFKGTVLTKDAEVGTSDGVDRG